MGAVMWLEMLEGIAQRKKQASHEFKVGGGVLDVEWHLERFTYRYTPAGCPTNEVDRDVALRILESEL